MMPSTPMWRRYLRFFGSNAGEDVDEELRFHLDAKVDELVGHGWSREAARAEALREFGNLKAVRQICEQLQRQAERRRERWELLRGWGQDFTYGLRQFGHSRLTNVLAILTLGIGVGGVAAVFSVVHAVVLQPLPFPNPDQIVTIWSAQDGHKDVVTPRNFDAWRRNSRSFRQVAALERSTFTLSDSGNSVQVVGGEVSSEFFSVFRTSPFMGRVFTTAEDTPPRQHLVILSQRLWRQHFGSDPNVIGRQIQLDRESYTVVGIMPTSFDLRPDGEQLWIPLALSGQEMNWAGGVLYVFGRLLPNVTLQQAQAEMNVQARILAERYPEMNKDHTIRVDAFSADLVGNYRQQLWILLAAVGSVFLIACANTANLLLARTSGRTRELTIRAALGASRSRIVRQLLTESFLLGIASALLGLAIAAGAIHVARQIGASVVPRLGNASIDGPVLLVLLGLAVACTLLAGAVPAFRASLSKPRGALVQGSRSEVGQASSRAKNVYIAFEVCLALVLLVAAGLLIRTAIAAQNVSPGFSPDRVIAGRTALPSTAYSTAEQISGAYQRILDSLAAEPGVRAAAMTSKVPLGQSGIGLSLKANAVSPPMRNQFSVELQYVSPNYFAVMQIPVLHGREFGEHDNSNSSQVVLVNETLAHRLWAGQNPVGQIMRLPELEGSSSEWQVVGVVADVHDDGLMAVPPAVLYLPFAQVSLNPWHWSEQSLYLVAQTQTESLATAQLLRNALSKVDTGLPLGEALTMNQRLEQSVSAAHFYTLLLTALGFCGLILTAAGIYGVVAYFVSRQRSEIGVRMALGATRMNVLLLVIRLGMRPVLIGVGFGVVVSLSVSRVLASQLYGAGAMDLLTFSAVIGILLGISLLACYLPARQATQIDPMIALRGE